MNALRVETSAGQNLFLGVCREAEAVSTFLAEKNSVAVKLERCGLVTAHKKRETATQCANLTGRSHMVERELCVALSAATYLLVHCRTLFLGDADKTHSKREELHPPGR
jgi:hypothetical protein